MELIDLVNSAMIFLSQMTLTQMVSFPTWISNCGSHISALFNFFLSSGASICSTMAFPPLEYCLHWNIYVFVSVSNNFPSNSKGDALFHCIAYDYSCADCCHFQDHLRDVPWKDIFELGASAAAGKFCD